MAITVLNRLPPLLLLTAVTTGCVTARTESVERSPKARASFAYTHPCPATNYLRGACPGYVVDHIKPLCAGGADHPANMQWQTVADARIKDAHERRLCNNKAAHQF